MADTFLTNREISCLNYLDGLMEANAVMIGERVDPNAGRSHRGNAIIGNKVARGLLIGRNPSLVTWLPDLNAYRITVAGREALAKLSS